MASEETVVISRAEYERFRSLESTVSVLKHQLAELQRLIFGAKSERFISSAELATGNLFEVPAVEPVQKPVEEISYTRSKLEDKKQPLRLELPAHLPRQVEVIERENIPMEVKKKGEAINEVLNYRPSDLYGSKQMGKSHESPYHEHLPDAF